MSLDSPTLTKNSISSINSSTTDLSTAETRPSEERDDFPLSANKAIPLMNPVTKAPEGFEAQLYVQHDGDPVEASAHFQYDGSNHNDSVSSQDTWVSAMVPLQHNSPVNSSFPEISKSPQQKNFYCGGSRS